MEDLRDRGVDILTLGQYLSPSERHLPVAKYITPKEFEHFTSVGYKMGFKAVLARPFARNSYRAAEASEMALSHFQDNPYLNEYRKLTEVSDAVTIGKTVLQE